ncbi:MAG TPA: DNA ligase D [Thermoanaerobaculia bacterium]|nr:DNA ligase D [Thermoanaerobaculia bacterium]
MALREYRKKRDFSRTPEPAGKPSPARKAGRAGKKARALSFVIQKHAARRLHYDFRLELDGVLKSWAVPKGPSLDPAEKRLAVHVEDHPLEYGGFEGAIPQGEYGGGTVLLWDRGTWSSTEGDPAASYRAGKLKFELRGKKLHGGWTLVRMTGRRAGDKGENWLLIKERDEAARPGSADAVVVEQTESVASGEEIEEIAADPRRVWHSSRPEKVARRAGAARGSARRAAPAAASRAGGSHSPGDATAGQALQALQATGAAGVRKAAMPRALEPELATLVAAPPDGESWMYEIKYDGYRVLCELRQGKVRLSTRHGKDWTDRFASVAAAAAALPADSALLDGEVTALLPDGRTSFQELQNALGDHGGDSSARSRQPGRQAGSARSAPEIVYFAFDLLYLDGYDLRQAPLEARKEALRTLLEGAGQGPIRWSDHVIGQGEDFFRQACSFGLEGIVAKRLDLPYRSGRSKDWLKVKCLERQELVIGGFTDPEGARVGFGALLLGVYDDGGALRFAGKVGTGFTQRSLHELRERLDRLEQAKPPFAGPPRGAAARGVHWVAPRLVAEVAFTEWTADGSLRHPTFQGLREDKPPTEVRREGASPPPKAPSSKPRRAAPAPPQGRRKAAGTGARAAAAGRGRAPAAGRGAARRRAQAPAPVPARRRPERSSEPARRSRPGGSAERLEVAGVRISHPDRVVYPQQGLTKRDLALYYERTAGWILPHLAGRPLTLVRCPEGQTGECFYQKHVGDQFPPAVERVPIEENEKTVEYGAIDSLPGLIALVQMGVLELHVWGAHRDRVERPDYMVFDLDPDEGLGWERVARAALELRDQLAVSGGGLQSFLKTTGGKGLHVVLPLIRRQSWDEFKGFASAVAERLAANDPDRYTTNPLKARRKGRIFIDYLRNSRGATSIAAYSTRARPGAPISTPLAWDELGAPVRADTFTVQNLQHRLETLASDPWHDFSRVRQTITAAMKKEWGGKW